MREYEINEDTLAIVGLSNSASRVLEKNTEYLVEQSAYQIMDSSCQFYGSSYTGRKQGAKNLLGIKNKAPILVQESKHIIFFPIISPRLKHCIWISLKNVQKIETHMNSTKITFQNGQSIYTHVSLESLNNQLLKSIKLDLILLHHEQ